MANQDSDRLNKLEQTGDESSGRSFSQSGGVDKQVEEYFPRHASPDKDVVEWILWISLIPYIVSFVLPAFSPGPKGEEFNSGFFAFYAGIFAIGGGMPAWLANPMYWVAVVVLRRRPFIAIGLGALACLFSLSFLVLFSMEKPAPISPRIGYFVWCSSFVLFTLGTLIAVDIIARRRLGSQSKERCLGPDDTSEPTECPSCGETIGAGQAECPKCGWSYRSMDSG